VNPNYISQKEEEINLKEKLKIAVDNLDKNEDFKFLVEYYTRESLLEDAESAYMYPDDRGVYFERMIVKQGFKAFLDDIRNFNPEASRQALNELKGDM